MLLTTLFTAWLVYMNYHFRLDDRTSGFSFYLSFLYHYCLFATALILPYLFYRAFSGIKFPESGSFWLLLIIAPAIFALKNSLKIRFRFTNDLQWNNYWNHIFYWPVLLVITSSILFLIWKIFYKKTNFFGLTLKNFHGKPYFIMLLIMVPLISLASTQHDFLEMYPKLKLISGPETGFTWWHKLLFELSYGSDFFSIELFFRGFLVLAFVKWFGKDALLPMACFYCTIHFGKPLGECISSYFGGMILGIIVYNTRSIFGGLIVHLGIAWMMELGGYLGNYFAGN